MDCFILKFDNLRLYLKESQHENDSDENLYYKLEIKI